MAHRPAERHLAAWRSLLEVHATVVELLSRELEEQRGLPLGWYDVLLTLDQAPEQRLRMQELAQSVLLSKSGLTRLIDRMEAEGLVRRERCPSDRRGAFAVLTPEGRSAFRRAAPVHLRGIQEHFARHLDDDEAATLHDALARVTSAARRTARARQPARLEPRSPGQARQLGRPAPHARRPARTSAPEPLVR
jgi:DNA-binding MarR family transcriptional regulator